MTKPKHVSFDAFTGRERIDELLGVYTEKKSHRIFSPSLRPKKDTTTDGARKVKKTKSGSGFPPFSFIFSNVLITLNIYEPKRI